MMQNFAFESFNTSASILKSLAHRMQWGRAAAGMEPVGASAGL